MTTKTTGWIGVDLDGTLAHYDEWRGLEHIGDPIPKMLARVKAWLGQGIEVRIVTARLAISDPHEEQLAFEAIDEWIRRHVGQSLYVTAEKDMRMIELWDDRAVQVIANTGERADGLESGDA